MKARMKAPEKVGEVAATLDIPAGDVVNAIASLAIKERVKSVTDEVLDKGAFGSTFFLVDDEPFWGWDRIPMHEKSLEDGSWSQR